MASMVGNSRSAGVLSPDPSPEISSGRLGLRVQPADGGRIAEFWVRHPDGGRTDILVPMTVAGFPTHLWPKAGCYPLFPFSNRIRGGAFVADGMNVRLPAHPGEEPHALHGFSQQRPWAIEDHAANCVAMIYEHRPDSWPWAFTARQLVNLDEQGLSVDMSIVNHSASPMPVGFGLHPYFATDIGDEMTFDVTGDWRFDAANIAVDWQERPESGFTHIQDGTSLSHYFTGWQGRALLQRRKAGIAVAISAPAPLDHFVFHVPPGGAYACLEPVSHVADAFNLATQGAGHTGHRTLGAGQTLAATIRIEVT
ncbi:aldose 1-epimerase [Lacibacterium aquatile]|uniref:Aldose 1-epimerase n=1 Tax=Lacibacterium aquatile TaxID=1168082 RepID=A0ABW5DNC4_9PROT